MIILMKKQFESKFQHEALALKYNLNSIIVWRLKHADKWVLGNAIGDRLFFSQCHWARLFIILF